MGSPFLEAFKDPGDVALRDAAGSGLVILEVDKMVFGGPFQL